MSLLKPNPEHNIPPQLEAMRWFWREAVITPVPKWNTAVEPYLLEIRKVFGSGVEFAAFHIA